MPDNFSGNCSVTGASGRVAAIPGIVLLFLAAYAGSSLWRYKSSRI